MMFLVWVPLTVVNYVVWPDSQVCQSLKFVDHHHCVAVGARAVGARAVGARAVLSIIGISLCAK